MYRLYYDYKTNGDVLFILLEPQKKATHHLKKGNVVAIYADDELIGINIFMISQVVKIKSHGVIFAPAKPLFEAINSLLQEASLPLLKDLDRSGYSVMSVSSLEEHPLDEKAKIVFLSCLDKKYETVSSLAGLEVGAKVVAAMDGTILADGTLFKREIVKNLNVDVLICSGKSLRLNEDRLAAFRPEGYLEGDDFFYAER